MSSSDSIFGVLVLEGDAVARSSRDGEFCRKLVQVALTSGACVHAPEGALAPEARGRRWSDSQFALFVPVGLLEVVASRLDDFLEGQDDDLAADVGFVVLPDKEPARLFRVRVRCELVVLVDATSEERAKEIVQGACPRALSRVQASFANSSWPASTKERRFAVGVESEPAVEEEEIRNAWRKRLRSSRSAEEGEAP